MSRYTEAEVRQLIVARESERLERKSAWSKEIGKKAREAVCAFANDMSNSKRPGVLLFGVSDDGTLNPEFAVDDQLLLSISEMQTDGNILPQPSMSVEPYYLDGKEVVVVTVEVSDLPPVRYQGRIWVRTGPRRVLATVQDERILSQKRTSNHQSADARLVSDTTYRDINFLRFRLLYLPSAFAKDVLEANERTDVQRMIALKLVGAESPHRCTLAGCLALVENATFYIAGAYIQFLRIRGTSIADYKDDEKIGKGHVQNAIEAIDNKLSGYHTTEVDYGNTFKERRFSEYPMPVLTELLRNAVMHRDYDLGNDPIRVNWYDDRVEFSNSGGPYGAVSVENFGQPGATGYRNPILAEAMKVLGLVQRFGSGIAISQKLCRENGNPPIEFKVTQSRVTAIVRPAKRPW